MGSWVTILRVWSAKIQNQTNWKHSHCTSHQSCMHQCPTLLLGDFPWEFLRWVSICFWCCIIFQVQSQCLHPTKPHMNEVEDEAKSLNMRLMLFPYNLWWIYLQNCREISMTTIEKWHDTDRVIMIIWELLSQTITFMNSSFKLPFLHRIYMLKTSSFWGPLILEFDTNYVRNWIELLQTDLPATDTCKVHSSH
jgi:hypothetical protein